MYTGSEFQTAGATTTNYQYQYQYQLPTTTQTTTTTTQQYTTQPVSYTQQVTTSQPVSYTQQVTTSQPVTYTQQVTTSQPVTYTQPITTSQPVTYTQQFTTTEPVSYTTSVPDYTQSFTQQTYTTTSGVPNLVATGYGVTGMTGMKPQPAFRLLRQGSGISPNEQQGIVSTAMAVYQSGITPISNNTASRIKKTLGGDWIVIVYAQGKPVDFNMTCVQGNDYMYFTLDNMAYQVCRLR